MKITASTIEFGTSKIVTLIGEGNGSNPAELLGSGVVPYDGFFEGQWNSPDEVVNDCIRRSIRQAENVAQQKIQTIHVGVPGEFIKVEINEVVLPISEAGRRINVDDVDRILADAMSYTVEEGLIIHRNPAWFSVDDKRTMEPVGMRGQVLRCMATFVVAGRSFTEDVTARLAAMDIQVGSFASSSLGEALMLIPAEERDKQAVLIDVGYITTEVMVVEGDALIFHAVVPEGGGHITADLAYGLQLPMLVAEQVKRKYLFGAMPGYKMEVTGEDGAPLDIDYEFARQIVEARVDEIAQMAQEELSRVGMMLSPRNMFYLTGGGIATMRGGREYVAGRLERMIKAPLPLAAKLNSPVFSSSLGLLELVYESMAQEDGGDEVGAFQKAGAFLKAFFTK